MLTCPAPWLPSQSVLHYTYAAHDAEQEIHVQAKIHRTVFWDLQNRSCNVSLRNYFCCHYHRVNTLIQAPTVQHPAEQSFAPSPFPSSTQPSFSTSLRQTHIPLSKAFFWLVSRQRIWPLPQVGYGHSHAWALGQDGADSKCCLPVFSCSKDPPLLTVPLLVTLCLQLPGLGEHKAALGFACSSRNFFLITFRKEGPPASQTCPTGCQVKCANLEGLADSVCVWEFSCFDPVQHYRSPTYCKCRRIKILWVSGKRMKLEK